MQTAADYLFGGAERQDRLGFAEEMNTCMGYCIYAATVWKELLF
jgi:hypothetical protein